MTTRGGEHVCICLGFTTSYLLSLRCWNTKKNTKEMNKGHYVPKFETSNDINCLEIIIQRLLRIPIFI